MATEIERKFLVRGDDWRDGAAGTALIQGYLARDPDRAVRIRIAGDHAWLNIKGATTGISRLEFEYRDPPRGRPPASRPLHRSPDREDPPHRAPPGAPLGDRRVPWSQRRAVPRRDRADRGVRQLPPPTVGRGRGVQRSPLLQRLPQQKPVHLLVIPGRARPRPGGRAQFHDRIHHVNRFMLGA